MVKEFLSGFKKFALRGNVLDMAVGVIVGGAFSKIVSSLVNDVIMPLVGLLIGGFDFKTLKLVLAPAVIVDGTVITPESSLLYGSFIQNIVDFLIIAFSIFTVITLIGKINEKIKSKPVEETPLNDSELIEKKPTTEEILTDIKDILITLKQDKTKEQEGNKEE